FLSVDLDLLPLNPNRFAFPRRATFGHILFKTSHQYPVSLADVPYYQPLQPRTWNHAMPSGSSNDPPQQPRSSGILAADNKFLIDRSIWNPNGANTYQPAHNRLPSHNNTFSMLP